MPGANMKNWDYFTEKIKNTRLTNMAVYQYGEKIAEYHAFAEHKRNVYSVTKSFTSAAAGLAVKEGLLSVDEYVKDCFKKYMPDNPSVYLEHLKVEHLLTMTLGQDRAYLMSGERPFLEEDEWISYSLSRPFVCEPGTEFMYNNAGPYLVGRLIEERAGCSLSDYMMPRLFSKIGIKRPTWELDPLGHCFGAGGLMLTISEMARFGHLYLNYGRAGNERILPESWIKLSKTPYLKKRDGEKRDDYGYLFWCGPHNSYRADGMYGQYIIILEEKQAVIVSQAECKNPDEYIKPFWEIVYPEL